MKKLYNGKTTNRVHPSPPPAPAPAYQHPLSSLPAAILTLATALPPEEQQVLSYLLGDFKNTTTKRKHQHQHSSMIKSQPHQPEFTCGCFLCYKSFWSRWDSSPNRHLIHLIIDAAEQHQQKIHEPVDSTTTTRGSRNHRRSNRRIGKKKKAEEEEEEVEDRIRKEVLPVDTGHVADEEGDNKNEIEEEGDGESKSSSVRRLVSFIGERVWGVWN